MKITNIGYVKPLNFRLVSYTAESDTRLRQEQRQAHTVFLLTWPLSGIGETYSFALLNLRVWDASEATATSFQQPESQPRTYPLCFLRHELNMAIVKGMC